LLLSPDEARILVLESRIDDHLVVFGVRVVLGQLGKISE
jgi:hypothetical protein